MPLPSKEVRVNATVEPELTVPLETLTVESESEADPVFTVIVGNALETAVPPIVAAIVVAVPEVVAIKVAV